MHNHTLYRAELLEHYRHPQNFGRIKKADLEAKISNPLCGDEITLQVQLNKSQRATEVKFYGSGCALSIAAASIFTQYLKGKTRTQLQKIPSGKIEQLLNIKVSPARKKCVQLPYAALKKIFQNYDQRRSVSKNQ
jgi:nitrogen fixation NifU-like protein